MLFITDEDVPNSVGQFLAKRGHEVLLVREYFLPATEDSVIARGASDRNAVIVTWNTRHFKALAKRRRKNGRLNYPGMSVLAFRCPHVRGLERLRRVIEEVEATFDIRLKRGESRVVVEIGETTLRIED